eukprot:17251-Heterococcus_DN1.PRE.1
MCAASFTNIYKQAPSNNHSANNSATNSPVQTINNGSNSNSSSMFSSNNVNNSTTNNSTNNNSNSSSRTTTPTSQQQQQKQQQQQIIAKPKRHGLSLGMSLAMGNTMSATLDKMREAMPNTPSYALDKMREAMPHVNSLQSASQSTYTATCSVCDILVAAKWYVCVCSSDMCSAYTTDMTTQWLLPSDSQRKVSILDAAKLSLEQAEDSRNACRQQWSMLCLQVQWAAHELQSALNENQAAESTVICELQDALRRSAVFESSTLANEQMVFKVLEDINADNDLQNFIRTRQSALQRTTVVNGSTPDAAIGNEETMDKLSITLLQQIFDIHIPSELQSQSEHKRQRHKQRQHRLKQLQGVEHDSDSDVQELEDSGIHTTLGMAAALVATLNSSNHINNAELPAPPCDTPITSIPLPKISKKTDGRKKSTDSNSGYSSVADTVVAPECTDDLLALLRLPLVSKQDVIKLLQQSIDEQQQQQHNSDDSSSTATATTEQHSSGSSSSSTDGAHTAVHVHDATGNEQTVAAATTADSTGQQQKQQQQRRSIKVELFSTDAISTLLTAIERGE